MVVLAVSVIDLQTVTWLSTSMDASSEQFLLSGCTLLTLVPSVRFFVGTAVLEAHLIYVGLLLVPLGSPTAWRPLVFLQTQSQQPAATRKHRGLSEKIRWGPSIWRVSNARLVGDIGWKSWGDEKEWEIAQSSLNGVLFLMEQKWESTVLVEQFLDLCSCFQPPFQPLSSHIWSCLPCCHHTPSL